MATRSDREVPRRQTHDEAGIHVLFVTAARVSKSGDVYVETQGHRRPHRIRSLGGSALAIQLTRAAIARLHINGGTWTSQATLSDHMAVARGFIRLMRRDFGFVDLAAPGLTPETVWDAILLTSRFGGAQRHLRTLLADCLPSIRADGGMFRDYLYARTHVVDESDVEGYAPEVADAIENIARTHVGRWYLRHRQAVAEALGHVPVDWLTLPASELVGRRRRVVVPPSFQVEADDLAAAMVLLALVDNKGPNLSVIQSYTSDSVERANSEAAFVTGVKARNHEVLRTPAPAGGIFSYGGLLEFVTAATRVDRHLRLHGKEFDRLLFVASGASSPMDTAEVNRWWSTAMRGKTPAGVVLPERLEFRRLRKAALLRGRAKGEAIIGQKRTTGRIYMADAVPDVILVPGLLNTQADVTSYWRAKTHATSPPDVVLGPDEAEAATALRGAKAVMDVGVAVCTSNGQSPTNAAKPCGLGPVACFVCPNGYRTPETIPGLIAAVQFTDNIRKHEPAEWLRGEAPTLNTLAQRALDQFPRHLIDAAPPEEVHNARALIACVYVETRTRD